MPKKQGYLVIVIIAVLLIAGVIAFMTQTIPQGESVRIYCAPESRNQDVCTAQYDPVCGWFNTTKIQCLNYPCALTAGNACEACNNPNVIYWTKGTCPKAK